MDQVIFLGSMIFLSGVLMMLTALVIYHYLRVGSDIHGILFGGIVLLTILWGVTGSEYGALLAPDEGICRLVYWISAALMLVLTAVSFFLIWKAGKADKENKRLRQKKYWFLIPGVTLIAAAGFRYIRGEELFRQIVLAGMGVFSLFMLYTVFIDYMEQIRYRELEQGLQNFYANIALTDDLTNLENNTAYKMKMEEIAQNPRNFSNAVLIILDINSLKLTNSIYGSKAGDVLVLSVARALKKLFRKMGSCYRTGGDEFAVILPNYSGELETIQNTIESFVTTYNETAVCALSLACGISRLRRENGERKSIEEWRQEADVNMYEMKKQSLSYADTAYQKEMQNLISFVATILEAKDHHTRDRSKRVSFLASEIAKKLGLSTHTIREIEMAAQIIDIGKIVIPDAVLLKKGKLTQEEFELIKQHTTKGADIIEQAKSMEGIALMVRHHHERYDGSGYPAGLEGDNIPIGSRIIALADSIDAMTSSRAYRDAFSLEYCRSEIEANLGIMYDPAIGRIVLNNWDEMKKIILGYYKREDRK